MSQEKVDRYKERKANRKKIYKKEKRVVFLEKLAAVLICLLAVGWLGYSIYGQFRKNTEPQNTAVDVSAIDDYMSTFEGGEEH